MRHTWIYSTTTTFPIFTRGKLIEKLLPPVAAAAAASSCSRWCSQGRVDGAAAVKVLVIQGSICAGNLKDKSRWRSPPLLHVKTTMERPLSAYAALAAPLLFHTSAAQVYHLKGNSTFFQVSSLQLAGLPKQTLWENEPLMMSQRLPMRRWCHSHISDTNWCVCWMFNTSAQQQQQSVMKRQGRSGNEYVIDYAAGGRSRRTLPFF